MKSIKAVVLVCAVSTLSGCMNYTKFVKRELKIPYVYIPPNNLDHPYTLVQSTPEGNYMVACPATLLTGIKKEDLPNKLKYSDTSTFGVTNTASVTFKVKLEEEQLGALDAKYTRINKVQLSLDGGKLVTLPDVSLAEVVKSIASTHCKDDLRILVANNPDSKFLIPMQLYAYNIDYHIYTEDGAEVTATLPPQVTQLVLATVGLGYKSGTDITMMGRNLYVGFRGTPLDATLASLLEQQSPMVVLKGVLPELTAKLKEKEKVIDVTSLVKELATKE